MTIDVMIIDDSAVVRQILSTVLNEAPDINVYQVASDPVFAQRHLEAKWPDVIVLDMEMPRMDGLTFLRKVMSERPTPIVICSSLTSKGCELTLQALSSGAVDIVTKPQVGVQGFLLETKMDLWEVVRAAGRARMAKRVDVKTKAQPEKSSTGSVARRGSSAEAQTESSAPRDLTRMSNTTDRIIAIGTSTGGTQALESILTKLPRTCAGIAVVQHMPEKFTAAFAARLNEVSAMEVKEAESGDRLIPGRVLIAPGGRHLEVVRSGAQYIAKVFHGPAVNRHCPSVDVLFRSVAKSAGRSATGVIMTGMGDDGAQGLLVMKDSGARTIAQDEASSIVFGMPKEAIKLGAAREIAALDQLPDILSC